MLAVYPAWVEADPQTQARLVAAWARRKRFEARILVIELAKMFGGEGGEGSSGEYQRVSPDELMRIAGITL